MFSQNWGRSKGRRPWGLPFIRLWFLFFFFFFFFFLRFKTYSVPRSAPMALIKVLPADAFLRCLVVYGVPKGS